MKDNVVSLGTVSAAQDTTSTSKGSEPMSAKIKQILLWVTGIECVLYALFIWVILSGNFIPTTRQGEYIAIVSSTYVMGIVGIWALIHTVSQFSYVTYLVSNTKPEDPDSRTLAEKWFDRITSLLPFSSAFCTTYIWNADMVAVVGWWPVLSHFVMAIVLISTVADFLFTFWAFAKHGR